MSENKTPLTGSKKIEDYLHLYYGAEFRITWVANTRRPYRYAPSFISAGNIYRILKCISDPKYYSFKMFLRPLSDMTEEEMKEIVLINYNMRNTLQTANLIGYKIQFIGSGFKSEGEIDLLNCNAETFKYLLSKSFDLFNLIESGLAIDKTKL